jgi:hypothetical protein
MDFGDIARRLTGISTPFGGISWEPPPESETTVARRVIAYLEDRRVLYDPTEVEVIDHCVASVMQIRHFLTQELGRLDADSRLAKSLRAMRVACRRFVERNPELIQAGGSAGLTFSRPGRWDFHRWVFDQSLGELRATFGICIAEIAVRHHLNVEEPLARILPADPSVDD